MILSCWDGIIIGETTLDDATKLLQYVRSKENVFFSPAELNWYPHPNMQGAIFSIDGQTVTEIILSIDTGLPLDQFTAQTGVPTRISLSFAPDCVHPYIIYDQRHFIAAINIEETAEGFIRRLP